MTVLYTPSDTNETDALEFDDGDDPSATNVNALGEAAFNTAKYASNRVGSQRVIVFNAPSSGSVAQLGATTSSTYGTSGDWQLTSIGVSEGDIVELSGFAHAASSAAGGCSACFRVAVQEGAGAISMQDQEARVESLAGSLVPIPFALQYVAMSTCTLKIWVRLKSSDNTSTVWIYSPYSFLVRQWGDNA